MEHASYPALSHTVWLLRR